MTQTTKVNITCLVTADGLRLYPRYDSLTLLLEAEEDDKGRRR